jgi:hypothetical protein
LFKEYLRVELRELEKKRREEIAGEQHALMSQFEKQFTSLTEPIVICY